MKKQYFLLGFLLLALAGLLVLSFHKWETTPQDVSKEQAIAQRNTALTNLDIQKSINKVNEDAAKAIQEKLQAENTTLKSQKATLCAQIKTAKLAQPLCQ